MRQLLEVRLGIGAQGRRRAFRRPQEARLQVRRPDYHVRIHAGRRHGERPRARLLPMLLAALPAAAYDVNGVALGARESEVKKKFPSIHCKELEWKSLAAERRCDDSRVAFGGAEVRITFYLRKDQVQAFDIRFDSRDTDRVAACAKSTSCCGKRATSAPCLSRSRTGGAARSACRAASSTKRSTGCGSAQAAFFTAATALAASSALSSAT